MTMFHMSNDSGLFHGEPGPDRLPLYEAKLIHQLDHRWATYVPSRKGRGEPEAVDVSLPQKQDANFEPRPRYWVDRDEVASRLRSRRLEIRLVGGVA